MKTRRCTAEKGSEEGKQTKCFSSMTRTHCFLQKKRVNPKTMTLHVLFSTHASCLPLLDRKSQWHLPGGPLDSGCNVTCQYHASVPSWFFALVLMLKTCIKAHAWHDVHCPMKGAGPCWGSSGDCSRICLCDVTLGSRNPGSTHWWH